MIPAVSRTRLLQLALTATGALLVDPRAALAAARVATSPGSRFATPAASTPATAGSSQASAPACRAATARPFTLDRPATVRLEAVRTALRKRTTVWTTEKATSTRASTRLWWKPEPKTAGRHLRDAADRRGPGRQPEDVRRAPARRRPRASTTPVVRVLGVEAAFDKRSYAPLEPAQADDHRRRGALTLEFLACGTETEYTDRTDEMRGQPIGPPLSFDWQHQRSGAAHDRRQPRRLGQRRLRREADHRRRPGRLRAPDPPTAGARHRPARRS